MSQQEQHRTRAKPIGWIGSGFVGLLLLALAGPGTIGAYHGWLASDKAKKISAGNAKKITAHEVARALEQLQTASSYGVGQRNLFQHRTTLRLWEYEQDLSQKPSNKAREQLVIIQSEIVRALKKAPANSNLWYLASEVTARMSGPNKKALAFLKMSYVTGPMEGWVMIRRLGLSFRVWGALPPTMKEDVRRQVRAIWGEKRKHYYRALAKLFVRTTPRGRDVILANLTDYGKKNRRQIAYFFRKAGWVEPVAQLQ